MKKQYVWVEGCSKCENGYKSQVCIICGGEGGRCSNPECVRGEVPVPCECNPLPFVEDFGYDYEAPYCDSDYGKEHDRRGA